jgi:KDO2-lipid IV(A) lauroyltransferase
MRHISIWKKIRNDLSYLLALAVIRFLRILPRPVAIKFMRLLARFVFLFAKKERRKILRHLSMAYGSEKTPEEIQKICKNVFLHFFSVVTDYVRLPGMSRDDINKMVTVDGVENLKKAYAKGKGVILLTAHFGNWELLGAWTAQNGFPLKVVGKRLFDQHFDKLVVNIRNEAGYGNISRGNGTKEIIRTLGKGQGIGMLIDQDTDVQGVFVDFFGHPAHTASAPFRLAKKYDTPIIPIFARLRSDFSYHIECLEPVAIADSADEDQDMVDTLQRCSDAIEQFIRQYPEQWAWMHRRWKKQPENI